jgi:hypothetical protein
LFIEKTPYFDEKEGNSRDTAPYLHYTMEFCTVQQNVLEKEHKIHYNVEVIGQKNAQYGDDSHVQENKMDRDSADGTPGFGAGSGLWFFRLLATLEKCHQYHAGYWADGIGKGA